MFLNSICDYLELILPISAIRAKLITGLGIQDRRDVLIFEDQKGKS